jgi:hypothetical protein
MRNLARLLILLAAAALPRQAAAEEILPGSPHQALAQRLVAMEREAWRLYKERDEAALRRLAPADFADLYLDGTVVDRERWLADMREVQVLGSELGRFHVFRLSDTAYLVTYEAHARGRAGPTIVETHVGVTSAWVRRGHGWQNLFYEENALEPVRRSPAVGAEASH